MRPCPAAYATETPRRTYDSSGLKELLNNAGGWAKNRDDVRWYVTNAAVYDSEFVKDEPPDLTLDGEETLTPEERRPRLGCSAL